MSKVFLCCWNDDLMELCATILLFSGWSVASIVAVLTQGMNLYNLTLQPPTAINYAIAGRFTEYRAQEVLVAREKSLEIYRIDLNGIPTLVASANVFGVIRSVQTFRLSSFLPHPSLVIHLS
jgi:hypothetical protein